MLKEKTQATEWKKIFSKTQPIKEFCSEHIKILTAQHKKMKTNFKMGKEFKQTFYQSRYSDGK